MIMDKLFLSKHHPVGFPAMAWESGQFFVGLPYALEAFAHRSDLPVIVVTNRATSKFPKCSLGQEAAAFSARAAGPDAGASLLFSPDGHAVSVDGAQRAVCGPGHGHKAAVGGCLRLRGRKET